MDRYDRQIRLWGEGGQESLSRSAVLVVGSTATATETLKNLVLPGIASFTIVDHLTCAQAHPANFFVPDTDDSSAAASAATHLAELNPSVQASYISASPDSFLDSPEKAEFFVQKYSLVVVAQQGMGHAAFRTLANATYKVGVPFMQVRSYGFLGLIRLQFPSDSAAVECDRDEEIFPDLRLHSPFPELHSLANDTIPKLQDPHTANRVPFVLILLVALAQYRKTNDGELPKNRDDSKRLVEIVKKLLPEGCPEDSLNFEEAVKSRNLMACRSSAAELPFNVKELFADKRSHPKTHPTPSDANGVAAVYAGEGLPTPIRIPPGESVDSSTNASSNSNNTNARPGDELKGAPPTTMRLPSARIRAEEASFWTLVAAVRAFYEKSGHLPLAGRLPDMAADTEGYVAVQRLFAKKAADDAKEVLTLAMEIAEQRNVSQGADMAIVPDAKCVAEFCKTIRQARVVRGRGLHAEHESTQQQPNTNFMNAARDAGALEPSNTNTTAAYYALLRAADEFYREHKRYPDSEADVAVLRQVVAKTKEALGGIPSDIWSDEVEEIVRAAGTELHNVAAFIGGIAAQEAVKVITRQFGPLNNTLIFDTSNMCSFSFSA